ncbi:hypothetical protein C2S52_010501 [Perilla frutescens var. hirtella]|uniref:Phytocyanin domain-containing protein n=1 Tax=Perilla frutescens var. hirtella TaxID=608512 RepID=A0AAD4P3C3_PERFH|nr:hypothetical protein C2S52_010501 [Perilla frutescens var. hirtella]KAH6817340.1 hypothetical protein C2S51_000943 [Perilla frutescens var. frutescens]KAH6825398.1 hypothetical protein C2S53_000970 [Perilla frutescens var. hirtella]
MGKTSLVLFGWLVGCAALLMGCSADTITVGDELGWTIPPATDSAYQKWARLKDIDLGDTIVFNWNGAGAHNVAQVTKEGYDNCSAGTNTSLGPLQTVSPYTFILNITTPQYFICTVADHCTRGQKVTIQVRDDTDFSAASTTAFSSIFLAAAAASLSLFI